MLPLPQRLTQWIGPGLLQKAMISLTIRFMGIAAMLAFHVLLARALSPEEYGFYLYAVSVLVMVGFLCQGGFQVVSIRFFHEYEHDTPRLFGFMITFVMWLSLSASLFALVCALIPDAYVPSLMVRALDYVVWMAIPFAIAYFSQSLLRARHHIVLSQLFEQIGLPLGLLAAIVIGSHAQHEATAAFFINAHGLLLGVIAMITSLIFFRVHPMKYTRPTFWPEFRLWISSALTSGVAGFLHLLLMRLDILILGLLVTAEEVAYYGVAAKIATVLGFFTAALSNAIDPLLSKKMHLKEPHAVSALLMQSHLLLFAVLVGCGACMLLLGETFLGLFGAEYVGAYDILSVLVLAQLCNIAGGSYSNIYAIIGEQKRFLYLSAAGASLLIGLLLYFIPLFGPIGAAYAVLSASALLSVMLIFQAHRQLKRRA